MTVIAIKIEIEEKKRKKAKNKEEGCEPQTSRVKLKSTKKAKEGNKIIFPGLDNHFWKF